VRHRIRLDQVRAQSDKHLTYNGFAARDAASKSES
jgi:hypothetical protein